MISKIIQIEDMVKAEELHAKQKYGCWVDFIDLEAKNAFPKYKVTTLIIKCTYRYNHYRLRDYMINK